MHSEIDEIALESYRDCSVYWWSLVWCRRITIEEGVRNVDFMRSRIDGEEVRKCIIIESGIEVAGIAGDKEFSVKHHGSMKL